MFIIWLIFRIKKRTYNSKSLSLSFHFVFFCLYKEFVSLHTQTYSTHKKLVEGVRHQIQDATAQQRRTKATTFVRKEKETRRTMQRTIFKREWWLSDLHQRKRNLKRQRTKREDTALGVRRFLKYSNYKRINTRNGF